MDTDKFSTLPDHVIDQILCLLPTRDAVRSKFISKRFWSCWTRISDFDFEEEQYGAPRTGWQVFEGKIFCNFVSHVLNRRINDIDQIRRLRLKCFVEILDAKLREEVGNWLQLVLSTCKHLKVCHLEFPKNCFRGPAVYNASHNRLMTYRSGLVPQCVFTSSPNSLVELTLTDCTVVLQEPSQLASLEILRLLQVDINRESFQNIILGCPLLQQVSIVGCKFLNAIDLSSLGSFSKRSLYYVSSSVEIVDISSVTDADISIDIDLSYSDWETLMDSIQHLQSFTARGWLPKIFAYLARTNFSCPSNSWKYVNVANENLINYGVGWFCCLLRISPCLEELIIEDSTKRAGGLKRKRAARKKKTTRDSSHLTGYPRLGLEDEDKEFGFICLRKHLKKVTIRGYAWKMQELVTQLAKIILENAFVLEEFVVEKFQHTTRKDMQALSQELSAIPMASNHAKLTCSCITPS